MTTATLDHTSPAGSTRTDAVLLVARLLLAPLFILAGVNKLGAMEATTGYIAAMGLPLPEVVFIGTVALEIGAGLLLLAGYKTRLAAIALGVFSILAALIFHSDFAQADQITAFLKNLAIAGGLFALAVAGSGRFGLDRG